MNRRGISPVIATVIIVAVAIAIAIAVAFWMTGIVGLFTGFEQIKVINIYATWDDTNHWWEVVITLRNTGTADATLDEIFLNGKPYGYYDTRDDNAIDLRVEVQTTVYDWGTAEDNLASMNGAGIPIPAGSNVKITLHIAGPGAATPLFEHGQSLEVKIHTASGQEYPKLTTLP